MLERFKETSVLREAVREQRLVQHEESVVDRLLDRGKLEQHEPGSIVIEQGAADDSVFFILAGELAIEVNGRAVSTRRAKDTVGEMSAIDPTEPRSATVRAVGVAVLLRVSSVDFIAIANSHPSVWRAIARVLSGRLRERQRFHRPPNPRPVLFLGSSVEGLQLAKYIQLGMKHEPIDVRVWADGVFGPSGVSIDQLLNQVHAVDFAVFLFGPDDRVASRAEDYQAPRDNVVFELGMFISGLGRERTFIVKDHRADLKIPSDLLGVTPITYVVTGNARLESTIATVCTELSNAIQARGPI
jgi:CRP/FNR family cyclic AMP-dependent transcriptional regulator